MITTTAQIIAKIFDPKQAEKLRGKGVVEKKLDNTTYLIRFSSGKIKVKVTSGTLTPDTVVQVKNRDGKIILQPVSTPGGHGDKIVLTGTKQETTVNKAILELLSIITDTAATKSGDLPDSEYASIVKKLAAVLQTNQQIPDLHKILQTTAKKIVNSASLVQGTPDKQVLSDIKLLVQSFQQKLVNLCCNQQNSIKLSIPVEQGFILFANKEEAIEWLAKTQPEIDKNALLNLTLPKSEPVIIRTVNTGDGASLAIVMNKEESALILDTYIHNEAKSPLWETVPAEQLFSILESKGSITAETMESIDKILKLYSSSSQIKQTPPPDIAKPVVQQWIALMLDNDTLLQTLTSNEPVHSAEDIVQLVEHDTAKSVPKAALISEIIKDVLTNTINNPDLPKTDIIANAFEKMGYNLEYELAKTASSETVEKTDVSDSVKAALLSLLLQTLPHEKTFTSLPAAESESTQEPAKEVQQLRIIESLVQTLMKDVDSDLEKVIAKQEKQDAPQSSEKAVRETLQTLKKILGDFIQQLSEDNQKLIELLNAVYQSKHTVERQAVTPQISIPQPPTPGSDSIDQLLSFLLRSFSDIEKSFEALKTTLNSTPSIDTDTAQQFIENSEKLLTVLKEFLTQLQDYNKAIIQSTTADLPKTGQDTQVTAPTPALSTEELYKFLENLKNLVLTLEGKPAIEAVNMQAKPPPSVSAEQLQVEIKSTLQAFITALEKYNQEAVRQVQEYTSDLKPQAQIEITKLLAQFSEHLKNFSDAVKNLELPNLEFQSKPTPEVQVDTPQVPIPQPPALSSDSINQLLSFLLRSFAEIEKSFEALKTTLNSTPSIDTNSVQQLTDTGEKELSIIKEFINQLQDYIKTLSQYKADTLSNISQEVKAKLQIPPFPTAELQTFLENLRNLTVTLEGKPEIETADTEAKPPPSLSVEQLQNQIRSTLQALITSLEQNNQEFMKQLQEYTSDLKPHTQTEINEFAAQLSELLKNLSDTVRSDIVDYLVAQEQFKEETPPVNKIEIEKLLNTLLQFVEKNRQEIQHYSDILKDLTPSEAKQLINSFLEKTSDIVDRIMAQLDALHNSIKNQPATPLNDIPGQNTFIKQVAADKINSFIKPLDSLLNTLLTTLKPSQTDHNSADQIKTFTDNLYKTIINARNSIFDEIASFTQKAIKNMEGKKGYNISNIYAGIKKLVNIVNTFNNNLLSTLSQEKLPIEHAFQNISKSMSDASSYWTGQSNTVLSETEQSFSRLVQSLKESLPQSFLQQSISQREPVKEGGLPFLKAVQNSISETLDQIKHYSSRVSNDFRSPEFTAVKNLEQQFHSTLKTMESSIKNMVINVRYTLANAEEKLLSSIENLQRGESEPATVSKNIQSIANRLSYDINRLFDSTVKEILTLLEQIGKEVEKNTEPFLRQTNQSVSQMKQEIDQLLRTINRQIDNFSSRTERALDSTLPDGMRQQVETALSRLESLQLLAKPTPTSDGQQQILSLPIKIGEEWTDVNILLIKKRDKKKGKISGNKFSVRMYVSPSQTGSIIVNMNYHKKHTLSVKIEFEKNEARLWFNKHKEQLINGLKENGMPSIALSLESASPKKAPKKRGRPPLLVKKGEKKSKIDISV